MLRDGLILKSNLKGHDKSPLKSWRNEQHAEQRKHQELELTQVASICSRNQKIALETGYNVSGLEKKNTSDANNRVYKAGVKCCEVKVPILECRK